jgi:hypothetical protein
MQVLALHLLQFQPELYHRTGWVVKGTVQKKGKKGGGHKRYQSIGIVRQILRF